MIIMNIGNFNRTPVLPVPLGECKWFEDTFACIRFAHMDGSIGAHCMCLIAHAR